MGWLYKLIHPSSRFLVTIHGGDIHNFQFYGKSIFLNKIDSIIVVSEHHKKLLYNKFEINADCVLSAGISKEVFYNKCLERKIDFLFVGSFYKLKGIDLIINAIKSMDNKEIEFCFIGSGDYQKELEKLSKTYNIKILNNLSQKELSIYYSQSKFLLLPSIHESFGLVITEAFYCGCSAIVSSGTGAQEQVIEGQNGLVFENGSEKSLQETINYAHQFSDKEFDLFSKKALESNNHHSLKVVCSELKKIYLDESL